MKWAKCALGLAHFDAAGMLRNVVEVGTLTGKFGNAIVPKTTFVSSWTQTSGHVGGSPCVRPKPLRK